MDIKKIGAKMSRKNSLENKAKRREARALKVPGRVDKESMWTDVKDRYGNTVPKQVMMPVRKEL